MGDERKGAARGVRCERVGALRSIHRGHPWQNRNDVWATMSRDSRAASLKSRRATARAEANVVTPRSREAIPDDVWSAMSVAERKAHLRAKRNSLRSRTGGQTSLRCCPRTCGQRWTRAHARRTSASGRRIVRERRSANRSRCFLPKCGQRWTSKQRRHFVRSGGRLPTTRDALEKLLWLLLLPPPPHPCGQVNTTRNPGLVPPALHVMPSGAVALDAMLSFKLAAMYIKTKHLLHKWHMPFSTRRRTHRARSSRSRAPWRRSERRPLRHHR